MRTAAEILFLMGRLETIVLTLVVVHCFATWHWRRDPYRKWFALGWLALFVVLSLTVFFDPVVDRATDGTGYVLAHLYGGIWRTDEEALTNILLRWRNLWLPVYVPWLSVWLSGMLDIAIVGAIRQRLFATSGERAGL